MVSPTESHEVTLTARDYDSWDAVKNDRDGGIWRIDDWMWTGSIDHAWVMTLISDVPAAAPLAADRTKCKAFCGHPAESAVYLDAEEAIHSGTAFTIDGPGWTHKLPAWCSQRCRNSRLPPLAAQPAETKLRCPGCQTPTARLGGFCSRSCEKSQPAPQPAPACAYGCSDTQANTARPAHGKPAPAKAVRCIGIAASSAHECRGPSLVRMVGAIRGVMCERWMMTLETKASDWTPNSGLTPYTGPERLERARLAHSSMWADEAEDVR
jgi:hypothetical protein